MQNLLVTRFANTFLEPLWNSRWVDHVQITVVRVDRRRRPRRLLRPLRRPARHGAEPPAAAALPGGDGAADLRRPRDRPRREAQGAPGAAADDARADVDRDTVAGQYAAGLSTAPPRRRTPTRWATPSSTETFVALRAEVQNWRWAGVPFYLRTGKRMPERLSEIVVVFKEPPHAMFPHSEGADRGQPAAHPRAARRGHAPAHDRQGARPRRHPAAPGLARPELRHRLRRPLARRLRAAAHGRRARQHHPLHAPRRGRGRVDLGGARPRALVAAPAPPARYPAGTHGPVAAVTLLERDGRSWQETE